MINLFKILSNLPTSFWKILAGVSLVVIIGLSITTCTKTREAHKLQNTLVTEAYSSKMAFDSVRAKDGTLISTQQQLLANKDAEIVKHIETEQGLRKLQAQVIVKTVYQVKTVYVPLVDLTKVITTIDTTAGKHDTLEFLQVPARVEKIDSNFQLDATILRTGLEVNYLRVPNTMTVTIGQTKKLFKHQSIVRIKNSNPYVITDDMKNIIVDDPQASKKQWKAFGIGFGTGVGTIVLIEGAYTIYNFVTGK